MDGTELNYRRGFISFLKNSICINLLYNALKIQFKIIFHENVHDAHPTAKNLNFSVNNVGIFRFAQGV